MQENSILWDKCAVKEAVNAVNPFTSGKLPSLPEHQAKG